MPTTDGSLTAAGPTRIDAPYHEYLSSWASGHHEHVHRLNVCGHQDTGAQCAARGVRYEPLVFTTQGGCDTHAEAIISQIAEAIAKAEEGDAGRIKAEMLQAICMSIMRSVAKAVLRRRRKPCPTGGLREVRIQSELATLIEVDD